MANLTLRQTKNLPLTHDEVDQNFIDLNNDIQNAVGGALTLADVNTAIDAKVGNSAFNYATFYRNRSDV